MSEPNEEGQKVIPDPDSLTYFSAASAGVAQSVSLGAQNFVDEMRNQGIVKTTAMGAAYAKWLTAPELGENMYKPLVESMQDDRKEYTSMINTFLKEFIGLTLSPANAMKEAKK